MKSPHTKIKDRIQKLIREIALIRDKGCIMREFPETGKCGGFKNDGTLILQFDHLHSRANNVSFASPDLGIIVCLRHHFYYKKKYPFEYERCAMKAIGKKRAKLLEKVRADKKLYPMSAYDWAKEEMALTQQLKKLKGRTKEVE